MTSSKPSRSHTNKPLTNFSIESLIGKQQVSHHAATEQPMQDQKQQNAIRESREVRQKDLKAAMPSHQSTTTQRKFRPKNFLCPACKMAFSNNGQLKNHVRIHTGERPFRCNHLDCNKTFTRNEELTRHKLIHTGVRPHSCTTCGKSFGRKDHLKKHIKTHEKKRIRRRTFVPSSSAFSPNSSSLFVPPMKPPIIAGESTRQLLEMHPTRIESACDIAPQKIMDRTGLPCTSSSHAVDPHSWIGPIASNYGNLTESLSTSTNPPNIQQLATDYWNHWYNLFGLYQYNLPSSAADRLSELFRDS